VSAVELETERAFSAESVDDTDRVAAVGTPSRRRGPSTRGITAIVLGLAVIHAVTIFFLAVAKHRNFDTYGFDFGIYDQAWWLVGRQGGGFDTVRGLPIWGHHPNLILWLLAPFARLGLGNWFLVAVQTAVLSLGALPVSWMARQRLGSARAGLYFAIVYLLYPPTAWLSWAPFHPECLSVTPMLFAIWFASQRRWWRYLVCIALVLSTREEAAIMVAVFGLVLLWQHRSARHVARRTANQIVVSARELNASRIVGLLTFLAGVAWFMLCLKVIIPGALGGQSAFYVNHFFAAYGDSLGSVAAHLAKHPSEIVRVSTTPEATGFQTDLFGPLGLLPFLGAPISLIALPQLASTLLGSEYFLRQITNQYTALMIPGLMVGTIDAMARFRRKWATTKPLLMKVFYGWLTLTIAVGALLRGPLPGAVPFSTWRRTPPTNAAAMREALALIPEDAAVAASGELVPHLTHREIIYNFPNPFEPLVYGLDGAKPTYPKPADWVIVNRSVLSKKRWVIIDRLRASQEWQLVFDRDGVVVLKRR
jgi:uncharacterized membrane protein